MLKILINNIKRALEREDIGYHKYQMSKDSSRVLFFFNNEDLSKAIQIISRVFGIHSMSPTLRTSNRVKNILERVLEVAKEILHKNDSFAINVKRSGKHEFTSIELAAKVGEEVLKEFDSLNLKVNLTNPDKVIYIEVRGEFTYIFTDIIETPWGGLPIETRKKIFVIDVGRLTDLLSGFLMMRRGAEIHPILFKMSNNHNEDWKGNWSKLAAYSPYQKLTLNIINLLDVMKEIISIIKDKSLTCAMCRILRFECINKIKGLDIPIFNRTNAITDGLSLFNNNDCNDLIDLDSISLNYLFSELPIFTPIVGFNAQKYEELLQKISKKLKRINYCDLKPNQQILDSERIIEMYNNFNMESIIEKAVRNMKKVSLDIEKLGNL